MYALVDVALAALQCGRNFRVAEGPHLPRMRLQDQRFNVAATLELRKAASSASCIPCRDPLQCGRNFRVAEGLAQQVAEIVAA